MEASHPHARQQQAGATSLLKRHLCSMCGHCPSVEKQMSVSVEVVSFDERGVDMRGVLKVS